MISTRLFEDLKFSIIHKILFHKRRLDLLMKLFMVYVKISYFHNVSKMPHEKVHAAKIKKKKSSTRNEERKKKDLEEE